MDGILHQLLLTEDTRVLVKDGVEVKAGGYVITLKRLLSFANDGHI